jgi:hypothetical protein
MMDLTWFILGALTGATLYAMYVLFQNYTSNWLSWSGLGLGAALIFFSIAWGVGAVLEGVPRAGSMGIVLFALPGLGLATVTIKRIVSDKGFIR